MHTTDGQLKHAVQTLTADFNRFKQAVQTQLVAMKTIVYSGGAVDENGNQLPNPVLSATQALLPSGETIMQYTPGEVYESMTYPNEYVRVVNHVVKERYDVARNIFVDFDYRHYSSSSFSTYFNVLQKKNENTFLYELEAYDKTPLPQTESECRDICRQYQELFFVDEQCSLRVVDVPPLKDMNIFENENCRDIVIKNCSNIYFSPEGQYVDLNLENCTNVYLGRGATHVNLTDISLGVIFDGMNLVLQNLQYVYIQTGVSRFGKLQHRGGRFLIVYTDSCTGSTLDLCGNTIIGPHSLNYSNVNMMNSIDFTVCIYGAAYNKNEGALNYAKAEINCETGAQIVLSPGCCNYGKLVCPSGSLKNGSLYFRNGQYYSQNYQQNLVLNPEIRTFYMRKQFKDVEIISPTECIIQRDTFNGPFDEWYILQSLRLNKYLYQDGNYYGYACENYDFQQFTGWGVITGQANATSSLIVEIDGVANEITFSNVFNIQSQVLKGDNFTVKKLRLILGSQDYNIDNITLNGVTILNKWAANSSVEIELNNTGNLFLKLFEARVGTETERSFSIESISISGTQQATAGFNIDIGAKSKASLKTINVPEELIAKIPAGIEWLFYDASQCTGLTPWLRSLKHIGAHAFENALVSDMVSMELAAEDMAESACRNATFAFTGDVVLSGAPSFTGPDIFRSINKTDPTSRFHVELNPHGNPSQNIFMGADIDTLKLYSVYFLECPNAFQNSSLTTVTTDFTSTQSYTPAENVFRASKLTEYDVSEAFPYLGTAWFRDCTQFTTLGTNIGQIPPSCCEGCTALNEVKSAVIHQIGDRGFYGCSSLEQLNTDGIGSYGAECLSGTSLASWTVVSTVTIMGQNVLAYNLVQTNVIYQLSEYKGGLEWSKALVTVDVDRVRTTIQSLIDSENAYAEVELV